VALAVILASWSALCGCKLSTDLRRAIAASKYVALSNELLVTGHPSDLRAAQYYLDKARALRPDDPELASLLVTRYVIAGAPAEAAQIIVDGQAGKVDADLRSQADACLTGDIRAQVRFMEAVLADGPAGAELLVYSGMAQFRMDAGPASRRRAMVLLDRAVQLAPDDATVQNNVGYTYADAGIRLPEALALVKRAEALDPKQGYIADSVGWAYFRRGMLREALPHLQRAAKTRPDSAEVQYHMGKLYRHLGRRREAQRHLKEALRLSPGYTDARVELDLCLDLSSPVLS